MQLNLRAHDVRNLEEVRAAECTLEEALNFERPYNLKQLPDKSFQALDKMTAGYSEEDWRKAFIEWDFPEEYLRHKLVNDFEKDYFKLCDSDPEKAMETPPKTNLFGAMWCNQYLSLEFAQEFLPLLIKSLAPENKTREAVLIRNRLGGDPDYWSVNPDESHNVPTVRHEQVTDAEGNVTYVRTPGRDDEPVTHKVQVDGEAEVEVDMGNWKHLFMAVQEIPYPTLVPQETKSPSDMPFAIEPKMEIFAQTQDFSGQMVDVEYPNEILLFKEANPTVDAASEEEADTEAVLPLRAIYKKGRFMHDVPVSGKVKFVLKGHGEVVFQTMRTNRFTLKEQEDLKAVLLTDLSLRGIVKGENDVA